MEKRRVVGGVCLETGTIPRKTFREAVRSFSSQLSIDNGLGLRPRVKPTITQLLGRVEQVIQREADVQQEQLERNNIDLIRGRAQFVDSHVMSVQTDEGTRVITAENFMIAVGTRPVDPPGIRPDGRTIINSDQLLDLENLPRTLAVVGAGVIGIEYASMFAARGVDVIVVDKRPRPLEFLDFEIIDELVYQMRQKEVVFRLGEAVSRMSLIEDDRKPQGLIELESGKNIVADMILFSAGRVGATDTLNLEAAGLSADDRGRLKVDENYCTQAAHVYAAGDVIGFPSLAATSAEQGRIAACHMFGVEARGMPAHFPFGIYAIPEISMVGATEQQLTEQKVPYETGIARYREIARGQILGDDTGMVKLIFHRNDRRLLGIHAIGTGATELIHVGQAVLALGGGLDYFIDTIFNYPTLAECYKVAAHNCANKLRKVRTLKPAAVA